MSEVLVFDDFVEDENLIKEVNQPKYWKHDLESIWFEKSERPSNVFEECVLKVVTKLKTLMDLPEVSGYDYWSKSLPRMSYFSTNDAGERINYPEWMNPEGTYIDCIEYHMNMDDVLFQRTGRLNPPALKCSLCLHTEQNFEGGKYRIITTPYNTDTPFEPPKYYYRGDDLVEVEPVPNRLVVVPVQCWWGVEQVDGDEQSRRTIEFLFWPNKTLEENYTLNDVNYIKEIFG